MRAALILSVTMLVSAPAPPARADALPVGDLESLQERLGLDRGHPVLVNFWATWCVPCIHEIPVLNAMLDELGPEGARFLAVSVDPFVYPELDEAQEKVERMRRDKSFRLPVFLYDGSQRALEEMFSLPAGLPQTLVLSPDGSILDRVEGQLRDDEVERLAGRIREALARSPSR